MRWSWEVEPRGILKLMRQLDARTGPSLGGFEGPTQAGTTDPRGRDLAP